MVQNILKPMSSHNYGTAATEAGNYPVAPYNTSADSSNYSASITSIVVLPANSARTSATFTNDSSSTCYVNQGATASNSSYSVVLAPGGVYTLPQPVYTGVVSAIWVTATGTMYVMAD